MEMPECFNRIDNDIKVLEEEIDLEKNLKVKEAIQDIEDMVFLINERG